jgi:hypothetical protein
MAVALVLTEPWSHGRMVAAGFLTGGLVLLLAARVLDRYAVANAAARARVVASGLLDTVASGGR